MSPRAFPVPGDGIMLTTQAVTDEWAASVVGERTPATEELDDAMATLWGIFNPGFAPLTPDHSDYAYYRAMGADLLAAGYRRQQAP